MNTGSELLASSKKSGTNSSIMLIDDDPRVHLAVRGLFDQLGYRGKLMYCSRATDAMACLFPCPKQRLPVTILLDLQMPRMSGIQFLRLLRQSPKLRDLTVFIVSGSNRATDRAAAKALGAAGFLPKTNKGFDIDLMREALSPLWTPKGCALPTGSVSGRARHTG